MLLEGLQLMLVGMGTVFAFLGLLVASMHASAAYFRQFGDELVAGPAPMPAPAALDAEIAVVLAVIAAHRGATS